MPRQAEQAHAQEQAGARLGHEAGAVGLGAQAEEHLAADVGVVEARQARLQLSRVSRAEMSHDKVDLSALAWCIAQDLQTSEPQRKVKFEIADNLDAVGDPSLLRLVLDNLIRNAWKFTSTRETAEIEFGVTKADAKCVYFVSDDGAGFDMAYADKLFGAFQRLHSTQEFEGTGIGLATVQRVIHRHGGRIWAEGQVDKGAE